MTHRLPHSASRATGAGPGRSLRCGHRRDVGTWPPTVHVNSLATARHSSRLRCCPRSTCRDHPHQRWRLASA